MEVFYRMENYFDRGGRGLCGRLSVSVINSSSLNCLKGQLSDLISAPLDNKLKIIKMFQQFFFFNMRK